MRGFLFFAALSTLIPSSAAAAGDEAAANKAGDSVVTENTVSEEEKTERLDSVVVATTRAGKSTPVTYTMVGREELRKSNPINSLPMNLSLQPSVVTVNEGGTGLGNSKMTVRGSKGSQVNVTLNGITLNDAESQEVFWVNIPALSNLISSVQLQRGLGTSANGSGAFGASINMSTASVGAEPYGYADFSAGSYNTFAATVAGGTGLTKSGLYFDAAYTKGYTDGYIRNAKAKVQSAFAVLGWMKGNNSLRLTYLMGDQHAGITWNGISLEQYREDRRYNEAGAFYDKYGNERYYDNETDNYTQHHVQLNYTHQFDKGLTWTTTANFTKGDGYYENYKAGKKFAAYGFAEDFVYTDPDGNKIPVAGRKEDFIIRKMMDNYYIVLNSDLKYSSEKWNVVGGVYASYYDGDHFGRLLWNDLMADNYDYAAHYWYDNKGRKTDISAFARAEYAPFSWLTAYLDLQYRGVIYDLDGMDDDFYDLGYKKDLHFFNPRAGLTFNWAGRHKAYASASMGHREPGRSDIKENIKGGINAIRPEKMVDVEIGYVYTAPKVTASANLYFMEYWDMLLETGKLSDVGYALKENVDRSWRRGIELAAAWQALPWLRADANLTLSVNKIKDYTEYVRKVDENWEELNEVSAYNYGKTNMLMSPSVIGMVRLSFTPFRNIARNSLKTTTLSVNGKYVGKQYFDNTVGETPNPGRTIPAYFVSDLSLTHEFDIGTGKLGLGGYVNNLFNNMYYADGGIWKNELPDGTISEGVWIYPQAPINFMFKVSYRF